MNCKLCGKSLEKPHKNKKYCGNQSKRETCSWKASRLSIKLKTIRERCTNPEHKNHQRYKHVEINKEWLSDSFKFVKWAIENGWDSKTNKVIDRIDNSKGYSPENCRFVTWTESARNKRNSVTNWQKRTRRCRVCKFTKHFYDFAISRKEVGGIAYECRFCRRMTDQKRNNPNDTNL